MEQNAKYNRKKRILLLIFCFIIIAITSFIYLNTNTLNSWIKIIPDTGTYSSIRAVEITGDGVLDIVIGGGGKEYNPSDNGIMAFNGASGELLWNVPVRNQIVGSAIFNDIDNDGIKDVFIGGRSAQLYAISGKTGKKIWEFLPTEASMDLANDTTLLNFFNPQWVPDMDNDGLKDLLVSFGGFVWIHWTKLTPQKAMHSTMVRNCRSVGC